ncbi:MAG: pyridoxal phosphate-dependent aminotransferase, partial [Acidobacteriota bacterium]|nr:pyridoxal phosphate-dependent aminotransferase [Acidobacteriota bacterium]
AITPKTRVLYINSPNNPAGGILTRADLERLAAIARERNLWVFSDEAYEDMVFDGEHVSIASLPGMYERTIPLYTFSKTYAVTGVRMGYYAVRDAAIRARALKVVLYTTSNVSSLTQYGAIGALEGSQECIENYRTELKTRRDLFYDGMRDAAPGILSGDPPAGAFYAFVKINPQWVKDAGLPGESVSWAMAEHLIKEARIGCVPGVDFGRAAEGYLRFCTCRSREELRGALASMKSLFARHAALRD